MIGFVLIHGAGLDTWVWEPLTEHLKAPSISVVLPGRADTPAAPSGPSDYAATIVEQVNAWPEASRYIFVGHSLGGVIALAACSSVTVVGFVGLCAAIPRPGGSFLSTLPIPKRWIASSMMRFAGTQPPAAAIQAGLCSGIADSDSQRVVDEWTQESYQVYTKPIYYQLNCPTLYLQTSKDREFSESDMARSAKNLGGKKIELATGHLPMLEDPKATADALTTFLTEEVTKN